MPTASVRWLLPVASVVVVLFGLEAAVRLLDLHRPLRRPVYDVDPAKRTAFLPGTERTYRTEELQFSVATNRYGRGDVEWPLADLAEPSNVLLIGDSAVFGYGVDDEESIPSRLEALFAANGAPREVFNFGMPGRVSLPEYRSLMDDALGIGIAARMVLVGLFVGNDFRDPIDRRLAVVGRERGGNPERGPSDRRNSLSDSALFSLLQLRVRGSPQLMSCALALGGLFGLEVYQSDSSFIFLREQSPHQVARFRRVLSALGEMKRACENEGRQLALVIVPNMIQVQHGDQLTGSVYDADKPNRLVLEYCEQVDLMCLDLLPGLREAYSGGTRPLYFRQDRHLNVAGNRRAAKMIFQFLQRASN